jgi:glycosyltransferase involved in cell wall biosynthesis
MEPLRHTPAGTRRVGFVLKGYPRLSESFILREILLLERMGLDLHIFALRDPGEPTMHERVAHVRARVTYLPDRLLDALGVVISANAARLAKAPRRTLAGFTEALVRSVRERDAAPLKRFLQAAVLVERALPGTGVTHLHAHFCNDPTSVAYFAHRLSGIPYSFSAHAKDIYTQHPAQLAAKVARARFVTTCTAANATHLERHANGATPVLRCYHGVETDRYRPASDPRTGVPHVLSVGRLVAKKGFPVLLEALAMLRNRGLAFQCTIVGAGPLEPQLREQRLRLRLEDQLELRGAMAEQALAAFYREVDVFALACEVEADGDRDGIPNVVVEAMACGLPVVSTRVSGLPECVEHGVTGLLVPERSARALADALANVIQQPDRGRALGRAGRARVERLFAADRNVRPIAEALHDALEIRNAAEVAHAVGG